MDLLRNQTPNIRFLYDLKNVLYDQEWLRGAPNCEVYYMYRELAASEEDKKKIADNGLRYDITVIPPKMLGEEFPKTLGHEHPPAKGTDLSYTEIYEVLSGEAYYLLQKRSGEKIEDVMVVHARKGDKVIVPPNYGHVTINASGQELKMANWVERTFRSDYRLFKQKHGACYYAIMEKSRSSFSSSKATFSGQVKWLKNTRYSNTPSLKTINGREYSRQLEKFGLNIEKDMYEWINDIEKLDFLKNPQNYEWQF